MEKIDRFGNAAYDFTGLTVDYTKKLPYGASGCLPYPQTVSLDSTDTWRYRHGVSGAREQKRQYYSPGGDSCNKIHQWVYYLLGAGGEERAVWHGRQTADADTCSAAVRRVVLYPVEYLSAGGAYYTRNNAGVWQKEFRVSDHLGSIRAIITNSTPDNFDYDAFGKAAQPTKRWSYLAREKEFEAKNVSEFGFRKYDEETGSFLQPDPLWAMFPGQSPYQYGYNSPLNWSDASGLFVSDSRGGNTKSNLADINYRYDGEITTVECLKALTAGSAGGGTIIIRSPSSSSSKGARSHEQSEWFRANVALAKAEFGVMLGLLTANTPSGFSLPGSGGGKFSRGIFGWLNPEIDMSPSEQGGNSPLNINPAAPQGNGSSGTNAYSGINDGGGDGVIAQKGRRPEYTDPRMNPADIGAGGGPPTTIGGALRTIGLTFRTLRFRSFSALKRALGPAGPGKAWHHIVEQNPSNIAKFGPEAIHNTENVIKLPHGKGTIHAKISGHYSSIQDFTNGKTVRQWLSTQSYQEQYNYGIKILQQFGWTP